MDVNSNANIITVRQTLSYVGLQSGLATWVAKIPENPTIIDTRYSAWAFSIINGFVDSGRNTSTFPRDTNSTATGKSTQINNRSTFTMSLAVNIESVSRIDTHVERYGVQNSLGNGTEKAIERPSPCTITPLLTLTG